MAWSSPRTWVAGEVVNATHMNQLRDQLRETWHQVAKFGPTNAGASPELALITLLTLGPVTVSGNPIRVEVACSRVAWANGDSGCVVGIYNNAAPTTLLQDLWTQSNGYGLGPLGFEGGGWSNWYEVTPSAGTITWLIRGTTVNGTGNDGTTLFNLRAVIWEKGGP